MNELSRIANTFFIFLSSAVVWGFLNTESKTYYSQIWKRSSSYKSFQLLTFSSKEKNTNNHLYDGTQITERRSKRSRKTFADSYFQKNAQLPDPPFIHATLGRDSLRLVEQNNTSDDTRKNSSVLIIGDVHGCFTELKDLVQKAIVEENGGNNFAAVILVGDLCNKGPDSINVIQFVREQPNWFAVRGNHDNGALRAMLGDTQQLLKDTYHWVRDNDRKGKKLITDLDVEWMANLPYTITILSSFFSSTQQDELRKDTIIVHAGLNPSLIDLQQQQNQNQMITMRNVQRKAGPKNYNDEYLVTNAKEDSNTIFPWASQWKGPQRVIFGHDAKRGLQIYYHDDNKQKKDILVAGLDTGAVYGNKLTGIILPSQKLVSVPSRKVYCPIVNK